MKKKALIVVAITGVLVCSIVGVLYPSLRARRIRSTVKSMDWLHANKEAVNRLSDKYGGSVNCVGSLCEYNVETTNRLLSAAHLAPRMHFGLAVHMDGNVVLDYVVSLEEVGKDAPDTWSRIWIIRDIAQGHSGVNQQAVEVSSSTAHKGIGVYVRLSPAATIEQQSVVDGLDAGCLSRLQGCSQQQLGPEIWRLGRFAHREE
jgi:hypothetical protein